VVHAYNLSTEEVEAGQSRVQGQPWLHGETLYQTAIKTQIQKEKVNFPVLSQPSLWTEMCL
jgi:hypothetical protein